MGVREDITAYKARRKLRMDAGEKKHGNTRLPYALCKKAGIDTTGMTPREAWEALENQTGQTAESAYTSLQQRWGERRGTLKSVPSEEEQAKGITGATEKIRAELDDLPTGTALHVGKDRLVKRDNDTWYYDYADASPADPMDQKNTNDLVMDLILRAKPAAFEKPKKREKGGNTKAAREKRKGILLKRIYPPINPADIVETVGGSDYTDFAVKTPAGDRKTIYRVADTRGGGTRVRRKVATVPIEEAWKPNDTHGWNSY